MSAARHRRLAGFTLAEVMIALAILGMALTMLVRSIAGNIGAAQQSMYMGLVADLGRGKMYDIEEHIAQEGFKDTEEHEEGEFDDEGWPGIKWEYRIIPVELPSFEKLAGMAQGAGSGSGSGSGSSSEDGGEVDLDQQERFQNSLFGNMASMFGLGGGGEGEGAAAGVDMSMIQMAFPIIQDVLKKSIRKVVLTVRWDTGFETEHIDFVTYLTDMPAMCKAMPGGCP